MLPLEKRTNDIPLGLGGGLDQRSFYRRVVGGRGEQHTELTVKRLLTGQRRHRLQHHGELIEELFRHNPGGFAAPFGLRTGDRRRLAPVLALHLAVEVLQRIGDDLVDYRLDRRPVRGGVVHEHAWYGVGQRVRAADNRLDAGGLFTFPLRADH